MMHHPYSGGACLALCLDVLALAGRLKTEVATVRSLFPTVLLNLEGVSTASAKMENVTAGLGLAAPSAWSRSVTTGPTDAPGTGTAEPACTTSHASVTTGTSGDAARLRPATSSVSTAVPIAKKEKKKRRRR